MARSTKSPSRIDSAVGSRIRAQRGVRNISQTELAEAIGVTFQQVQKYENATNRVSASRLHQIAHTLQVPVEFFFREAVQADDEDEAGESPVTEFLNCSNSVELMRAFIAIEDPAVQEALVALVRAVSERKRSAS
jgi:transcriptional regulator with XRE-family HTH domain